MKLYSKDDSYILYQGNMLDILEVVSPNSIDSIVTDPPYGLTNITKPFVKENLVSEQYGKERKRGRGFMGKTWDGSGIEYNVETWKKCYDILKDGGYLLAFGGSRTYHKIASAIEDAGFEIRDCIMWLYGSGFPKSMSISKGIEAKEKYGKANTVVKRLIEQSCEGKEFKIRQTNNGAMGTIVETTRKHYIPQTELSNQWQGWGTCLKPAYEPIIVARKPFKGTLIDNVLKNGVGGINIDECRIPFEKTKNPATNPLYRKLAGYKLPEKGQISNGAVKFTSSKNDVNRLGRFPANIILTFDESDYDEVCGGFPNGKKNGSITKRYDINNQVYGNYGKCNIFNSYDDEGSASRYFYCAKASSKDREQGLEDFEAKSHKITNMYDMPRSDGTIRKVPTKKNIHPTVKPTELMQYLIRLVTPKGGTICDPFMGSGSTGKAVMYENKERNSNYKFIGIEITEEYLPISDSRIRYAKNNG